MMTGNGSITRCEEAATRMRINVLRLALLAGSKGAHLGGCLSVIEILAVLYCGIMHIKPGNPKWKSRDRFILSKGQGSLAQYTALEASGIISEEELFTYGQNGGLLPCASSIYPDLGIEYSNGSLGLGLTYATGLALASKKTGNPYNVYVLLGDGECNEGSVWEPAMSAPHFKLSNLTAIVDLNSLQSDGKTCDVLNVQLENMWKGFGWEVIIVDGHDVAQLLDVFRRSAIEGKPRVVIARTIKGKGVSFMENNNEWHHKCLPEELFDAAMAEISGKTKRHDTN
ncbi:MAG: transketolase [Bacteroidetes bacterium]|nr:transketolase [Bacteroidota bacterium]